MNAGHGKPIESERDKVGMLLPPPILLLIFIVAGVVVHLSFLGPFVLDPAWMIPGGGVAVMSALAIAHCILRFNAAGTPFRPVAPATMIVHTGLYRISRNPMYAGMAGILWGLGVALGSYPVALAMLPFVLIVHFGAILPEERYLEALHGDAYRSYKLSVPRWL